MRKAQIERNTKETQIKIDLCLDGGDVEVSTGIGFFDHMLVAFGVQAVICRLILTIRLRIRALRSEELLKRHLAI